MRPQELSEDAGSNRPRTSERPPPERLAQRRDGDLPCGGGDAHDARHCLLRFVKVLVGLPAAFIGEGFCHNERQRPAYGARQPARTQARADHGERTAAASGYPERRQRFLHGEGQPASDGLHRPDRWAAIGGYLPDGHQVTATISFAGAPSAPDPASIYSGQQLIMVKTDGTTFPDGDSWKCVTCGVPAANAVGRNTAMDYPQPFADGKRVLVGTNIVDCSPYLLTDKACTADRTHIYPIRFNTTANGSGKSGFIRELRLNPDQVHLGFNAIKYDNTGVSQFAYLGRLTFDPVPKTGLPLAPRYDLTKVTRLYDPAQDKQPLYVDPKNASQLVLNTSAQSVGELRGFTKDGKEVAYIGSSTESGNIDVFAADLTTGKVRRLTSNPEYTDPIDISPDDNWTIAMDTRGSGRQLFLAAMRGVPPLTDLVTTAAVASVRNNGARRFFQPYLIDRYGDRGSYQGQQINACPNPSDISKPGSICDPNWNGEADPRWSPDGTAAVYWQALAVPPACGGANPLPVRNPPNQAAGLPE